MADDQLRLKQEELEKLQNTFDDYVRSSSELETEYEEALAQADKKVEAASAALLNESRKIDELQKKIAQLNRAAMKVESIKSDDMIEIIVKLENENEDLTNRIRVLESTEEDLNHRLHDSEEEVIFLRAEVEEGHNARKDLEDLIISLRSEVASLRCRPPVD